MRKIISILLLVIGCIPVYAQVDDSGRSNDWLEQAGVLSSGDSNMPQIINRLDPTHYFFAADLEQIRFSGRNTLQMLADSISRAGALSFEYTHDQGGLHDPQIAYKHQEAAIETWGFAKAGRVKIGGYFNFRRIWEDSLSANLSGSLDGISPYYYFSPKAGNFERQIYEMGVSFGYDLIKDQLYIGTDLDYLYNSSTGSVDPRPADQQMRFKFRPGLSYRWGNSLAGISLLKGYGHQSLDIDYKSDQFKFGNSFPERFYYLNMGYGSLLLKDLIVQENIYDYQGLGAAWSTKREKNWLRVNLDYEKMYMDSKRKPDTLLATDAFSRWSLNHYNVAVLFTRTGDKWTTQWKLDWHREKGHDYNTIFAGRNYFASGNEITLSFLSMNTGSAKISTPEAADVKRSWFHYGLDAGYKEAERTDILASHYASWTILSTGLNGGYYHQSDNLDLWKFQWKPMVIYPLTNEVAVAPTQENAFSNMVVWPGFYYRNGIYWNNDVQLSYMTKYLISGIYAGFQVDLGFSNRVSEKKFQETPVNEALGVLSAGSRFAATLSFILYL